MTENLRRNYYSSLTSDDDQPSSSWPNDDGKLPRAAALRSGVDDFSEKLQLLHEKSDNERSTSRGRS
jgi:hypothetical protein